MWTILVPNGGHGGNLQPQSVVRTHHIIALSLQQGDVCMCVLVNHLHPQSCMSDLTVMGVGLALYIG